MGEMQTGTAFHAMFHFGETAPSAKMFVYLVMSLPPVQIGLPAVMIASIFISSFFYQT
jgi:hypothetical protein